MSSNPFDQASRYLAKLDPPGLLGWLLRLPADQVRFRGWLDARRISFPGEPAGTCDTVAVLEDVTRGGVPWALPVEFQIEPDPLMFGRLQGYLGSLWVELKPSAERGDRGESGIMTDWVRLASAEPDARRRADFGGLVLVFAEAASYRAAWKQALKEWNMIQSQQVLEWQAEARVEERAAALLDVLEAKFGGVPAEVASAVRATTDLGRLKGWVVLAAKAPSLEQFRYDAQL